MGFHRLMSLSPRHMFSGGGRLLSGSPNSARPAKTWAIAPRIITDSQIRNARRVRQGGETATQVSLDLGMPRATGLPDKSDGQILTKRTRQIAIRKHRQRAPTVTWTRTACLCRIVVFALAVEKSRSGASIATGWGPHLRYRCARQRHGSQRAWRAVCPN